ncbi:hypothetical protein PbB2_00962 [Candidatus Phycosocius bacilliformis]|uniref:Uncharacterized protein n=1 Tax=Candidatus Phycosocius bacilliformis TaxID=1445552 RepID=A0A2P2E8B9_9PROT|nr:hypothetical protein PbB2_00962 [Candidatus Phycosocius bacilliformis]
MGREYQLELGLHFVQTVHRKRMPGPRRRVKNSFTFLTKDIVIPLIRKINGQIGAQGR